MFLRKIDANFPHISQSCKTDVTCSFFYKSDTFMFKAFDLFDEKTQKAINLGDNISKINNIQNVGLVSYEGDYIS